MKPCYVCKEENLIARTYDEACRMWAEKQMEQFIQTLPIGLQQKPQFIASSAITYYAYIQDNFEEHWKLSTISDFEYIKLLEGVQ